MDKTLKKDFFLPVIIPENLLKDPQACQINAIKTVLHNLTKKEVDIEVIKRKFHFDEDGALNEPYHFQDFNNYLNQNKIHFRTNKGHFNDITDVFCLLKQNIPVPIFFGSEIIKLIMDMLKMKYEPNLGEQIFECNTKHVLVLVGYNKNGEELLFFDPVYQLPYLQTNKKTSKSDALVLNWKDAFQHYKQYKSHIHFRIDRYREKKFKNEIVPEESKEKQITLE